MSAIQRNTLAIFLVLTAAGTAHAAGSPFSTGSMTLQTETLSVLTPVAVIAVMVLGALWWFGRMAWVTAVGCMTGIVLVFGAPQIVTWVRGAFGV